MLSAVFEELDVAADLLEDVNSAVSEACNNVVLHAYRDRIGPLEVALDVGAAELEVRVRDHGIGLERRAAADGRLGVGLPMMEALAERAEFSSPPGGGTDVRLTFTCDTTGLPTPKRPDPGVHEQRLGLGQPADAVVPTCPIELLASVMGSLATRIAAGARFSLDRLSDLRLLTDAISAEARTTAPGPRIAFALGSGARLIELAVGPIDPSTSQRLRAADWATTPAFLPLLLADELTLEPLERCEILRAVIADRAAVGRPGVDDNRDDAAGRPSA
jgi:serine/threonine-protein kinase RsbW